MPFDTLCLTVARPHKLRMRSAATIQHEPKPEELVEHSDDDREHNESNAGDSENGSNHDAYRLPPTASRLLSTSRCSLPASDRVDERRRAKEDLSIRDGGRTERVVLEIVLRQELELRARSEHRGHTVFVRDVDLPVGQDCRPAVARIPQPLRTVDDLPRPRIQAVQDPAVVDRIEVRAIRH